MMDIDAYEQGWPSNGYIGGSIFISKEEFEKCQSMVDLETLMHEKFSQAKYTLLCIIRKRGIKIRKVVEEVII